MTSEYIFDLKWPKIQMEGVLQHQAQTSPAT